MAAEAYHDSADDGALRDRFFGDPVQVPALALVRPIYRSIYQGACMKELLAASGTDAAALGLDHDCGIGYGETSLEAIWRILRKVDLRSYEPAGASVLDCGSGVGNVVVAVALLAAAGECCGGRVARVEGVELLLELTVCSLCWSNVGFPVFAPATVAVLQSRSESALCTGGEVVVLRLGY